MASRLNPYLNFTGNARQAMEFYRDVFGGNLTISTFADYGMGESDKVMHAMLETDSGYTIMASDAPPGMESSGHHGFGVSLSGDRADADRLRGCWEGLSDGGNVTMPMQKQAWGDEFGMVTDKFGIPWLVNIGHE
jgi:PhnB protein